jgi:ribosomal-protein-alanine N-acetyltransferase
MRLETERLILRHPEARDAEDYFSFCNSEFVLRYNAMTLKTLENIRDQFSKDNPDTLLLELKATGKVIGEICIQEDSLRYGVASKEISYHLCEQYARQGYMKEALGAVIEYLFENENLECISARCFQPNTASLALLRSLGFQQNGVIPRCVKGYRDRVFDDVLHTLFLSDFQGDNYA